MLIFWEFFKTKSDQKIHQNAPYFQNFLRGSSICPWTPYHVRATIVNLIIST